MIITTHESLILNRLNLKKAIWIQENNGVSLQDLSEDDIKFFIKNDNFDILRFILAKKVVLVEGASEFIALPSMIKNITNEDMDNLGIEIISMGGIHYEHFIKLSEQLNKPVLILTDNDGEKVESIATKNNRYSQQGLKTHIYTPSDENEFTFEVAIYNANKKFIETITPKKAHSTTFESHKNLPVSLSYSLHHKTETAFKIAEALDSGKTFGIPTYIKEGIKCLEQSN